MRDTSGIGKGSADVLSRLQEVWKTALEDLKLKIEFAFLDKAPPRSLGLKMRARSKE